MENLKNKLVIFDCDGVLVDSEIIANRLDAAALKAIGYNITTEESIKKFTGLNAKTVCQVILNESGKNIPLDYFDSRQTSLLEAFESELRPLIKPFLECIEKSEISRCVASSSPRNRVIRCLELTEQFMFFSNQSVFTSQQVSRGKPAPDLFLFAARQMGFAPENCIVVEDSSAGIEAAISAGMHVVGFLGGAHAQYNWYQERIGVYNVPIAKNSGELLLIFEQFTK